MFNIISGKTNNISYNAYEWEKARVILPMGVMTELNHGIECQWVFNLSWKHHDQYIRILNDRLWKQLFQVFTIEMLGIDIQYMFLK